MIRSMTGFASKSKNIGDYEVKIEIKSVNSRFLDIHIKSNQLNLIQEKKIRDLVKKHIKRGRVDFYYTLKKGKNEIPIINKDVLNNYAQKLSEISSELNIENLSNIAQLLTLPGVFTYEENEEGLEKIFNNSLDIVEETILELLKMREKEGKNLFDFILDRINFVEDNLKEIEKKSVKIFEIQFNKIKSRMDKLLSELNSKIDEKIILEISALAADKFDISEEIERFKSHINQFKSTLEGNSVAGKKLDFIIQEMNREINTILSKSDLKEIKKIGLDIKTEVEKIREQVQNIE